MRANYCQHCGLSFRGAKAIEPCCPECQLDGHEGFAFQCLKCANDAFVEPKVFDDETEPPKRAA